MTEMELHGEVNWLAEPCSVSPARLYLEHHAAFGVISLDLPHRTVRAGQTAAGKEVRSFRCALAPDMAETLARQLLRAVAELRRQTETGDH